jgi:Ca2+-binding EF-hand superfamily protein
MDVKDEHESILSYLLQKYDANHDGRVDRDEYQRADQSFDRLDGNGDGAIDGQDFKDSEGRGRMMTVMLARRLIMMYFQGDEERDSLALAEMRQSIAAYDASGDGVLERSEFEKIADERKVEPPESRASMIKRALEETTPWEAIAEGVDSDDDLRLTEDELVAFFRRFDDGDEVWQPRGRGRGAASRPMSGPPEGEMAPDFELQPPDGGATVKLSSFRGNLPVALIFGSYT